MRVANLTVAFAAFIITTAAASEIGYVKRHLGDLIFFAKHEGAHLLVYAERDQTRGLAVLSPGQVFDIPSELKTFLKPKSSRATPSLSHDRTRIAFIQSVSDNDREQAVWIYDLRNGGCHEIARFPGARSVAWSPAGDALAVDNAGELTILLIATQQSRPIASGMSSVASWSPDAHKIAYDSFYGTGENPAFHLNVVDVETGESVTVAEGHEPSWSPRGDRIAYLDDRRQRYLSFAPTGGQSVPLIKKLRGDQILGKPVVWSPDGRSVIISAYYDGGTSMTLVDLTTSKQTALRYGGDWILANWR